MRSIDASVEHVEAVSPEVCITPAHRLATRNFSKIDTPVRHGLRSRGQESYSSHPFLQIAFSP